MQALFHFCPSTPVIMGSRTPLTIPLNSSALIREKQQTFPSFSHPTSTSLSPGRIPARTRNSFGRTIWPRSSTETRDSTVKPPDAAAPDPQHPFPVFFIAFLRLSYEINTIRVG